MKSRFFLVLVLSVLLSSCGGQPTSPSAAPSALPSATPPTATRTAEPSPTVPSSPAPTQQPTQAPTITATPPPEPEAVIAEIIQSEHWVALGLPGWLAERWQAFAGGGTQLSGSELRQLNDFLQQWRTLNELVSKNLVTRHVLPAFRVGMGEDENKQLQLILYAVALEAVGGNDTNRIFMTARDRQGEPVGLMLAPVIEGLDQRLGADGRYVEYVDPGGGGVLLYADAHLLDGEENGERQLKQRLDELYSRNSDYARSSIYPRFFFPVDQVEAGFFNLEKSITYSQILQMNEAFDLFDRPGLAPLKQAFFGEGTSVLIIKRLHIAAGLNYTGTGVVELDRQDLFGNRYYLAEVLAHEGSHVLQGGLTTRDTCREILKREVGDHTIPTDFYTWTADELVQAVKDERVGAYHVSLWVLHELGLRGDEVNWLQSVIRTGQANGQSVVIACK